MIFNEFKNILINADQPHAVSSAIGISIVSKKPKRMVLKF